MSVFRGSVFYGSVRRGSVLRGSAGQDVSRFIAEWDTTLTNGGSASNQIKLSLISSGTYNFNIQWGDGTSDTITAFDQVEITHTYPAPGMYTTTIESTITGFSFLGLNSGERLKIGNVLECGPLRLVEDNGQFQDCPNIDFAKSRDILNVTGPTMLLATWKSSGITGGLANIDLLGKTSMAGAFRECVDYNEFSNSDYSTVTSVQNMYFGCTTFDQNIGNYKNLAATNYSATIRGTSVNQNLGNLNVTKAITMSNFATGTTFDPENIDGSLDGWIQPRLPPANGNVNSILDNGDGGTTVETSFILPPHIVDGLRIELSGMSNPAFNGSFLNIFNVNNTAGIFDINVPVGIGGTGGAWNFDGVVLRPFVTCSMGNGTFGAVGAAAIAYLTDKFIWIITSGGPT